MRYQRLSLIPITLLLVSCGGPGIYAEKEQFQSDPRHHREFKVAAATVCEAVKRALMSDGYVIAKGDALNLSGSKEFQVEDNHHAILNVFATCDQRVGASTLFVTATEEHFDVKNIRKSTLFGVPVVAPISIGTRMQGDYQVKIRGETVTKGDFYERFYQAVQRELPR